jgi:1-acyl-sn-glycerol-3-phosphate acyltransferase
MKTSFAYTRAKRGARRRGRGPLAYRMAKAALDPPLRRAYRVDVEGVDNVPDDEGVILVANHRSFMDSIFLALASPEPVAFVAKAEYFENRVTRWLFNATGQIPLRRGSPAGARDALAAASAVLEAGGTLGIYPEGTRSRDGKLHRGKLGPARLAAATGAAIVPVGLVGTDEVQLPDEKLPHLFRPVAVKFGRPRHLPCPPGGKMPARRLRATTDELMHDIAELSGAEYVDSFA